MTAKEFVSHLAPLDLPRIARMFDMIGLRIHEFRLGGGQRISDATDFSMLMQEISAEMKLAAELANCPSERPAKIVVCPSCYHVHEGDLCCNVNLASAGRCDCKAEVVA
jgi:hypothetical protein